MCKRNRPFTAEELWTLIENKLVDDGDALGLDKLRAIPGITDHDWEIFQRQKGCGPLPSDLKDFFAIHDGGKIGRYSRKSTKRLNAQAILLVQKNGNITPAD